MWNTCEDIFQENQDSFSVDGFTSVVDAPCVKDYADTALCTYSQSSNKVFLYCRGRYYETSPSTWNFQEIGTDGVLGAIWEDSKDCDELALDGWEWICPMYYAHDDDYKAVPECARNSFQGYVFCDNGKEYRYYGDGRFKLSGSGSPGAWIVYNATSQTAMYSGGEEQQDHN
jgi:hypothetical protein